MNWTSDIPVPAWLFFFLTALMFICAIPKVEQWGADMIERVREWGSDRRSGRYYL